MSKFTVELDYDAVDNIVVQVLKDQYSDLEYDLERRKDDREMHGIFSSNKDEDIAEIQRHLSAIATVLVYNMTHKDFEEWRSKHTL